MTFFTHPEPGPLRELLTDRVLPPKCYGTTCFGAKTKVTGAPQAPTDHRQRWNSASDMAERFLEQQPAAVAALLSPGVGKREEDSSTFTESDISSASEFVQTLKPIKVASCVMSANTHPTLSIKAPLHAQFLRATRETLRNSPFIIEPKEAIHHNYYP